MSRKIKVDDLALDIGLLNQVMLETKDAWGCGILPRDRPLNLADNPGDVLWVVAGLARKNFALSISHERQPLDSHNDIFYRPGWVIWIAGHEGHGSFAGAICIATLKAIGVKKVKVNEFGALRKVIFRKEAE